MTRSGSWPDRWFKLEIYIKRDPASGIRDFEAVDALARAAGLHPWDDQRMPANNQLLLWRRA